MTRADVRRWARTSILACALTSALSLGALAAGGCGIPTFVVEQYAGPRRPASTVAILRINGGSGPDFVSVDGEPIQAGVQSGTRLHIEVLPGPHEVVVAPPDRSVVVGLPVRFMAEAGKFYRIEIREASSGQAAPPPSWEAAAFEVDASTDARLGPAAKPSSPAEASSP